MPSIKLILLKADNRLLKLQGRCRDIYLKNDLVIHDVIVTRGNLSNGIHLLIGMDIITLGDFSITNHSDITCMS